MSDLAIIDPNEALERAADPGEFVVLALERGKTWLAEALAHGDLDALVNAKGYAETLRVAVVQKQLGKDAELTAQELVRRAERCIALGVRAGQGQGEILRRHEAANPRNQYTAALPHDLAKGKRSPTEFFGNHGEQSEAYALTDDVSDEQFEEAIAEAKEERNLSRANLVRKVKGGKPDDRSKVARDLAASGHTTAQIAQRLGYSREGMRDFLRRHDIEVPADAVVGKQRNLDSTRLVSAAVDTVTGIGMLFDRIDYGALDPEDARGWLPTLNESISALNTLRNRLKEVASRDQP